MDIKPFALERYFAKYEFSTRYLLSSSDCEGLRQTDVLALADSECRGLWDNLRLGYTESLGLPLLREAVAKLYPGISRDEVLIITPEEGVFITMNTLLKPGDHVVCTYPGYQSLYGLAEAIGCKVDYWQPHEAEGWRFRIEDLQALLRPETKLIVVNFPHNPTGYLPSREEFLAVVELARSHNIHLFSDEMYRFLEHDEGRRLPSAVELYDKAIALFGLSKTFGLAGVRLGWLVTKDRELYERLAAYKDYTTICSSAPSEVLALVAIRSMGTIVGQHRTRLQKNHKLLGEFFGRQGDVFQWTPPAAGTICFPRLRAGISASQFCEQAVKEAGIMVLPSTVYDYDDAHIRIGFGRDNFPDALSAFEEYVKKYSN